MTDWYYHDPAQGGRVGPYTDEQLRAFYRSGRIQFDTLVWHQGLREWTPLERRAESLGLYSITRDPAATLPVLPSVLPAQASATLAATRRVIRKPPRPGLSGCMIALIVVSVLAVVVVVVLAAIAVPSYQDYVARAKVVAMIAGNDALQAKVAEYRKQYRACPSNKDLGVREGPVTSESGRVTASVTVGTFDNDRCGIELRMTSGSPPLDGKAVWLEHDASTDTWQCSSEVEDQYLPEACRE